MAREYKNKISMTLALFFGLAVMLFGFNAFAGSAHLTWNANSETDLAGYTIYYDTTSHSGTCPTGYAHSQDAGNVTSYWFDALTPGQTYYFQLTASDTSNNESGCSTSPGEVSKLITWRGDLDGDHDVDIYDYGILSGSFNGTSCNVAPDIDRDCRVTIYDYGILSGEFLNHF